MTNVSYNLTNISFFTTNGAFCYIKVSEKAKFKLNRKIVIQYTIRQIL